MVVVHGTERIAAAASEAAAVVAVASAAQRWLALLALALAILLLTALILDETWSILCSPAAPASPAAFASATNLIPKSTAGHLLKRRTSL